MKLVEHKNGTYSITDLSANQRRAIESALRESADIWTTKDHTDGGPVNQFLSLDLQIADERRAMAEALTTRDSLYSA